MKVAPEGLSLTGIALPDSRTGEVVDLGARPALGLVVLIRHRNCIPCHEHLASVRDRAEQFGDVVAVGFSPAEGLARLASQLDWPWPLLSDTERVAYHRLRLARAKLREVWTPGTKEIYRRARDAGVAIRAPVEDPLQLGGDAVVRSGTVLALWRPASPDDRPPVEDLLAAVDRAASASSPGPAPVEGADRADPRGL